MAWISESFARELPRSKQGYASRLMFLKLASCRLNSFFVWKSSWSRSGRCKKARKLTAFLWKSLSPRNSSSNFSWKIVLPPRRRLQSYMQLVFWTMPVHQIAETVKGADVQFMDVRYIFAEPATTLLHFIHGIFSESLIVGPSKKSWGLRLLFPTKLV